MPLGSTGLISAFMGFTTLRTLRKWNRIAFCDWLISPSIMSSGFACVVTCFRISSFIKAN